MPLILTKNEIRNEFIYHRAQVLKTSFFEVRSLTLQLCHSLSLEHYSVQSMPDVSPPKWHLAHTTWFFENFLLVPFLKDYKVFNGEFNYFFNSYYKGVGAHWPRAERGLLQKPSLEQVQDYRETVERGVESLLETLDYESAEENGEILKILELGIHHEQQHQELLMMDLLHIFQTHFPSFVYQAPKIKKKEPPYFPLHWHAYSENLYEVGAHRGTFSFDNENPRHRVFLENFALASRLVTNGEYTEFIEDGAYKNPLLWLSEGWELVQAQKWEAPLYWRNEGGDWLQMTLSGMQQVQASAPVCHVSYYEADAYARWRGKRLPREEEWEVAAEKVAVQGVFLESKFFQPQPLRQDSFFSPSQLWGDVWEWTQSPYSSYPRFKPFAGKFGEYNAKFMCNQFVLRGGSCVSPQNHLRASYRNFFSPHSRWQFSGIRLAEDL